MNESPQNWGPPQTPTPEQQPKKRHRVFWWSFLAIQVVFIIWIITGVASSQTADVDTSHLTPQQADEARDAGTAIGVALIVFLWAATDIVVGGTYAVYRLVKRGK